MNKYQESLKKLICCANQTSCDYCEFVGGCVGPDKIALPLQELVCKTKEKKPIKSRVEYISPISRYSSVVYYCPECNADVYRDMNNCCLCGQALDWSDEDE